MNVLILGGTGAIGTSLVDHLSKMGYSCTVTSRFFRTNTTNIKYVQGNAHDDVFLYSVLKSEVWDAIIDFMVYSTTEFSSKYRLFLDHTSQYIFLSSSRVYAESDKPLTEESNRLLDVCDDKEYLSTDEYALAKARQEDLLLNSGKNNWTIIRPYVTFNSYRLQLSALEKESWLYRAFSGRTIIFPKDLSDRVTTFTFGEDVSQGIASLIGDARTKGECYHITNNHSYRWSEILDMYLDAIEKKTGKRPKVFCPEKYESYMGGSPIQVKYDRLYNRTFDNKKINQFVDVGSFHQIRESIEQCITTFYDSPSFYAIDYMAEAKKDKLTKEWTPLSNMSGKRRKLKYLLVRSGLVDAGNTF